MYLELKQNNITDTGLLSIAQALKDSKNTTLKKLYINNKNELENGIDNLIRRLLPTVTQPKVTQPKVTPPKVTPPKVTQPKVTQPKVTPPIDPYPLDDPYPAPNPVPIPAPAPAPAPALPPTKPPTTSPVIGLVPLSGGSVPEVVVGDLEAGVNKGEQFSNTIEPFTQKTDMTANVILIITIIIVIILAILLIVKLNMKSN